MAKRDFYEVLGVVKTSTEVEIKASYRKLAMKYHPDRNQGDKEAEDKFKEASEAYEVLSNSEKRAIYDRYGHQGLGGQSGFQDVNDIFSSFGSIFEEFFGFSGGGPGGRSRVRRGADLRYDLALEFEESVFGLERDIEFERPEKCETCHGSGAKPGTSPVQCRMCGGVGQVRRNQGFFSIATTCPQCRGEGVSIESPCQDCRGAGQKLVKRKINVKIPAGVDSGVRLRISGEGEAGPSGGPNGDLYVILHVKESDRYERDGIDIIVKQPIGMVQAALGTRLNLMTLDGERTIDIPAGSQFGDRITIAGAGVPHLKGIGRGDLHVELLVTIPKKLTREQKEILQKYAEVSGKEDHSFATSLFERMFRRSE
jgi:molecular chaperone DnaJ